jgi:hypothetical protein
LILSGHRSSAVPGWAKQYAGKTSVFSVLEDELPENGQNRALPAGLLGGNPDSFFMSLTSTLELSPERFGTIMQKQSCHSIQLSWNASPWNDRRFFLHIVAKKLNEER